MRKLLTKLLKVIPLLLVMLCAFQVHAQRRYSPLASSDFNLTLANDVQTANNILEFDVYLLDTDATEPFEMAAVQAGILVDPAIYNGGTITISVIAGSSQLSTVSQQPTSTVWSQAQNTIKLTPKGAPGTGNGSIISTITPGTKVIRLRITNTVAFTANSQANLTLNFTTSPYPTKVNQYIGGINTILACSATNCFSNAANIVLNPSATPPEAYAVTGGGSYCQGGSGLPVGVTNSETGVAYTLFKEGVAQVPTVAGTGSVITFGNQLAGTYTVSGTSASGTTPMSGSAVITETATVAASVTIAASGNNVNAGTLVTFTATPVGGGTTPTYEWFKNAVAVASGAVYSYVPVNNDLVYAVMTSDSPCSTGSPATSNSVTMVVVSMISNFNLTLANDAQTANNVLEFDVFLLDADGYEPFEMAAVQAGIVVNPGIYNGGTITTSVVSGSSQLSTVSQQPTTTVWSQVQNTLKLTPKGAPGTGNGSIIGQTAPGTKVCRLRITNSVPFTANSQANLTLNFTTSPYPTKVNQYIAGTNTILPCSVTNCFSNAANIILNPGSPVPTVFAVTGGGAYCQNTGGLSVGVANSEAGVTYTIIKDGVAQLPTITGTGLAISFGNQLAGTYTVSGTNGGGTTAMTGNAVITSTSLVVPTFTALGPYAVGTSPDALPLASLNGISGTWLPSAISTASTGTMVYTFTPDAGQCATEASMDVTVNASTKTLNLKAYLQGFWNGSGMNQAQDADMDYATWNKWAGTTVDTLSVYLANATAPFGFVFQAHDVNISVLGILSVTIPASLSGSYYIALLHRSSVETWSASPVSFAGGTVNYDFTTSASQAFGSNQFDLNADGSVWGLYGGEVYGAGGILPADGYIDINDLNAVYNENVNALFGYMLEDVTGDGFVDINDLNLVYNNNVNGIGLNTPVYPMKKPVKK